MPHVVVFSNEENTVKVELHLAIAGNVLLAIALWSSAAEYDQALWRDHLNEVDELEDSLSRAGSAAISLSVVLVGKDDFSEQLQDILPKEPHYMGQTIWGNINHYPQTALLKRHIYLIETADSRRVFAFLTKGLAEIDWPIHRLVRELSYYDDQRRTIQQEKKEIDRELNDILHRKTMALKPTSERIEALEEEISRLSKMYSLLATDMHLVKESSAGLKQEIEALNNSIEVYLRNIEDKMGNGFPDYYRQKFEKSLTLLQNDEADLRLSLDSAKAAIDVVRTQVELFRGGEGMALQEQTKEFMKQNTALQVAAQVIELVLIFYYTIHSWDAVALPYKVEELSPWIKFSVVGFFSVSMVVLTHQVAKSIEHRRFFNLKLALSLVAVLIALAAMILTPVVLKPGH